MQRGEEDQKRLDSCDHQEEAAATPGVAPP